MASLKLNKSYVILVHRITQIALHFTSGMPFHCHTNSASLEALSHVAVTAKRLFIHKLTTSYNNIFVYTDQRPEASRSKRNFQKVETGEDSNPDTLD